MNIICWNCRGVGSTRKDAAIRNAIVGHKCFFLGLVESKHKELQESKVRFWWGHSDFDLEHTVAIGGSGGVIVCWDTSKFEKLGSKKGDRWILIQGILKDWAFKCEILTVYAPNSRDGRKQLWDGLLELRTKSSLPLMVMGDFNEVRRPEERSGGSSCLGSISEFKDWSDQMLIEDMPLLGRRFTWVRGTSRSRLDRIFCDQEWSFKFPECKLRALPNSVSDHAPLALSLAKQASDVRPFRSLDMWFSHPGFIKLVREEWRKLGDLPLPTKLKALHNPIRRWNRVSFGNIESNIKKLEEDQLRTQRKIDDGDGDDCEVARLAAVEVLLNKWIDRKASYWQQMSRDKWIKAGDRNTKYYHAIALGRRRFKRIDQVKNGNRVVRNPRAIKIEILNFYKALYRQKPVPNIHIDNALLPKVSIEQVEILERRPTIEEINLAIQDCDASKASGYDGFNFKFIKELWQDIGREMCDLIYEFFDIGSLPREINRTWVTLIPKIEGALDVKDFRPISMIGSIYKIIAKILAKRMARVLPDLIGETQSAFVKNRQILDGALIANEVIWWMKKTKQKGVILKLDFQKAYDTVRWDFLEETLLGMGFRTKWTNWIMECVRTASMSILVNGSPTSPFHLQRGLRQGDPLSPFLFLLIAETFNRLVLKGREIGVFKGISVGTRHVPITHLQFADDTIIFSPADDDCISNYKKFLHCFALMSGLHVNFGKSALIPLNCEENWVEDTTRVLNCRVAKLPITYLGIPLGANPRKILTWKPIIDKVEKRLALWKARNLSRAGRLVLVKAVLNNLPMYYLSLFRIPKKVARRIIHLQRRFFWGKEEGAKGGNLVAWKTIQKPMEQGGLGVGDIYMKNASLLFKWWWRFKDEQKPLWKQIIKSNHGIEHFGELQKRQDTTHSSIWRQITDFKSFKREIQEVAANGIRVKIGNGAHTRFWHDNWLGNTRLKETFPRLFMLSTQKEELIEKMGRWDGGVWRWNLLWRRRLFVWEEKSLEELLMAVNQIVLRENTSDVRVWSEDNLTSFSVSNFVLQVNKQMENEMSTKETGRLAWKNLAPPRAQLHVWFVLLGRLNTKERLFRLGTPGIEDGLCTFCKDEPESIDHLFFSCKVSSSLWYFSCACWSMSICLPKGPEACFLSWLGAPFKRFDKKIWISLFYVVSWTIWDIRNKIIFQDFTPNWEFEKRRLLWRLGTWVRGWCSGFPFSPTQMADNLNDIRGWRGFEHKRN